MQNEADCIREPEGLSIPDKLKHYGFELSGRKVETLPGSPNVGRITSIKQLHKVLGSEHLMTPDQKEALIQYQWEIFRELKRSKAKHVFAEGVRPEDLDAYKEGDFEEIKKAMRNPSNMREMMINYGGAILYVAEDPKTRTLHATEDWEIMQKSLDYEYTHGCLSKEIQEERESHVASLIQKFLAANTGQSVSLVYGAGHTFHDNILKQYGESTPPLMETIGFTNRARALFQADERALKGRKGPGAASKEKDREPPFGFPLPR